MAYPSIGDDLTASTINNWISVGQRPGGFVDQLFDSNAFIKCLKNTSKTQRGLPPQDRAYRELDGGANIQFTPLLTASADPTWMVGDEVIDPTGSEPLVKATTPWAMVGKTAMITDYDDALNSGKNAKADMWQARVWEAMERVALDLDTKMAGNGGLTGVSGYKSPNGLGKMIAVDPTADTVFGIARATYTDFQNYYVTSCGLPTTGANAAKLGTAWATCMTNGNSEGWDLIIAGLTAYAAWEMVLTAAGQVQWQNDKGPDWGYPHFHYKGAPIVPSSRVAVADELYGLVTKYMFYAVNKKMNLKVKDVDGGPGQFVTVRKISHMCQFGVTRPNVMAHTADWSTS